MNRTTSRSRSPRPPRQDFVVYLDEPGAYIVDEFVYCDGHEDKSVHYIRFERILPERLTDPRKFEDPYEPPAPTPPSPKKERIRIIEDPTECSDEELRRLLQLEEDEVPHYVRCMRALEKDGYPPAFIDDCTVPFFGEEEELLKTKKLTPGNVVAIKGYTHVEGNEPTQSFVERMQKLADEDYKENLKKAKRQLGVNRKRKNSTSFERKTPAKTVRFDAPMYKVDEYNGYPMADRTRKMQHKLENFRSVALANVEKIPQAPPPSNSFLSKLRELIEASKTS
ncbi:unnamed protein product [Bursaphelenchus okinawaensis]|uniref:Uncharacterized protein n=1 Tax=Bursaphelenchus okinawaensis TaxID=465554 RepID=A0A811JR05_9BILA|nr:unnamed protein product [Bursaphelenchus okinawaensis]CAG9079040.1 unnamed protein product [Bursaphelenchus okinawaensis]